MLVSTARTGSICSVQPIASTYGCVLAGTCNDNIVALYSYFCFIVLLHIM